MSITPGDQTPIEEQANFGRGPMAEQLPGGQSDQQASFRENLGKLVDSWQACVFLPLIAIIFGLMTAVVAMVIATIIHRAMGGEAVSDPLEGIAMMAKNPLLLILLLIPNQLVLLFFASGIGKLSRYRFSERLALLKGHDGIWTWPIYILATPVIGFVISSAMEPLVEESSNMKLIADIIHSQQGLGIMLLVFLIAVVPGICEEVMFRGFSQNFLAKHWGVPAAILVSSILFSIAHIDPVHVISVFPIGIWLGLIAWRSGSIIPAILCHFFNNLLSVLAVYYNVEKPENEAALISVAGVSAVFFVVSIVLFATRHQNRTDHIANHESRQSTTDST